MKMAMAPCSSLRLDLVALMHHVTIARCSSHLTADLGKSCQYIHHHYMILEDRATRHGKVLQRINVASISPATMGHTKSLARLAVLPIPRNQCILRMSLILQKTEKQRTAEHFQE